VSFGREKEFGVVTYAHRSDPAKDTMISLRRLLFLDRRPESLSERPWWVSAAPQLHTHITSQLDPNIMFVDQSMYRSWAWTLWEATVPIPEGHSGKLEMICKAVDSSHNVQPDSVNGIWNLRGLLNNSWHRVSVQVEP